jgi:hypothetical protein
MPLLLPPVPASMNGYMPLKNTSPRCSTPWLCSKWSGNRPYDSRNRVCVGVSAGEAHGPLAWRKDEPAKPAAITPKRLADATVRWESSRAAVRGTLGAWVQMYELERENTRRDSRVREGELRSWWIQRRKNAAGLIAAQGIERRTARRDPSLILG